MRLAMAVHRTRRRRMTRKKGRRQGRLQKLKRSDATTNVALTRNRNLALLQSLLGVCCNSIV